MWTKTHSKFYPDVSAKAVWEILVDVNNWSQWHGDLEYCKLDSDFVVGKHFTLKPKGAPGVKIILTEIKEGHFFTDCTAFFGAKMFDTHSIEEKENGILLINKIVVEGPLKWLWIKLVAQGVADSVPDEMDALVARAHSLAGKSS